MFPQMEGTTKPPPYKTNTEHSIKMKTIKNHHLSTSPRSYQSPENTYPKFQGPASSLETFDYENEQS